MVTSDGSNHTDVRARINRGRAGFAKLHKFWRHTDISTAWKQRVFNAVFLPMLTYGMESACLTQASLQSLDAFQAQRMRYIHNIKSTYYTKVLNPTTTTHSNAQVLHIAKTPTISQHIQHLQLQYLGHILRGNPDSLETDVCFTQAMVYRGGMKGDGIRKGHPKMHWVERATQHAWWLLHAQQSPTVINSFGLFYPWCFLVLKRIAQDRIYWGKLAKLPTSTAEQPLAEST